MDRPHPLYDDPHDLQFTPDGLESELLIGGDLFVRLGHFDFCSAL